MYNKDCSFLGNQPYYIHSINLFNSHGCSEKYLFYLLPYLHPLFTMYCSLAFCSQPCVLFYLSVLHSSQCCFIWQLYTVVSAVLSEIITQQSLPTLNTSLCCFIWPHYRVVPAVLSEIITQQSLLLGRSVTGITLMMEDRYDELWLGSPVGNRPFLC